MSVSTYTLTLANSLLGGVLDGASPYYGAGSYTVNSGATVPLNAIPNVGWVFSKWQMEIISKSTGLVTATREISYQNPWNWGSNTPTVNYRLTPLFTQIGAVYPLTVQTSGTGSVAVSPASGDGTYPANTTLTITATPAYGSSFTQWLVDGLVASSGNPYSLRMDKAHTIQAVFTVAAYYTLTLPAIDPLVGSYDPNPAYLGAGSHQVAVGATVTFGVIPASGYRFDHWESNYAQTYTANPLLWSSTYAGLTFIVTPIFVSLAQYVLSVLAPVGGGTMQTPTVGDHSYPSGTIVDVIAVANDSTWVFQKWLVNGLEAASHFRISQVIMDSSFTLQAVFVPMGSINFTLTVLAPVGSGTMGTPTVGAHDYPSGTTVPIQAIPAAGSVFSKWLIDGYEASDHNPSGYIYMVEAYTVQAVFTAIPTYRLTYSSSPAGIPAYLPDNTPVLSGSILTRVSGSIVTLTARQEVEV